MEATNWCTSESVNQRMTKVKWGGVGRSGAEGSGVKSQGKVRWGGGGSDLGWQGSKRIIPRETRSKPIKLVRILKPVRGSQTGPDPTHAILDKWSTFRWCAQAIHKDELIHSSIKWSYIHCKARFSFAMNQSSKVDSAV